MSATQTLDKLTVVVPVGPGDALSARLCEQLAMLPTRAQVRVVRAEGDCEATPAFANASEQRAQWQSMQAPAGRATQQNAGARGADGEWLWFLHADSVLAPATLPALARFIETKSDALGYFDLHFLDDGPALMGLNACGAWLRSRWLGLPFGDQGLVLLRAAFEKLGGFDTALSSGEDHDLVWRARRAGLPLRAIGAPIYTSARKYAEQGWWRTTAHHLTETGRQARRFSRPQATR
ncbi:MAG: glycosyltransferase [Lysobacterales bacterium]